MTTITILGSGRVAKTLAGPLAAAGHDVRATTRADEQADGWWAEHHIPVTDYATGLRDAEVVINATPGEVSVELVSTLQAELAGKILIDLANATKRGDDGLPAGLAYPGSSLAEHLQAALPDTRVVKTLNTMLFSVMSAPGSLSTPPTAFLSGDDADAKQAVRLLLADLGWSADQVIDLGGLASARATEAIVTMVPGVMKARGMAPFAISVVM